MLDTSGQKRVRCVLTIGDGEPSIFELLTVGTTQDVLLAVDKGFAAFDEAFKAEMQTARKRRARGTTSSRLHVPCHE